METSRRKRHSTASSTESVVTKKRKKSSKRDQSTQDVPAPPQSQPSPLTTHTSTSITIHTSPTRKRKTKSSATATVPSASMASASKAKAESVEQISGSAVKVEKRKKKTETEEVPAEDPGEHTEPQTKVRRKGKSFYLKPANGSWCKHIGSLLIYRCVCQAMMMSLDPREHDQVNWGVLAGGFVSAKDLELIWCLIKREYPHQSLSAIRDELKPYTTLTVDELVRASVKDKYKSEYPKAPPTPYMLFVQSKSSSMKSKHPGLSQTDIAKKLGKKWQSMGADKQDKYRQQYQQSKKEYESKLAAFYDRHPDAKVPVRIRSKGKQGEENLSPEEKRIRELKAILPRAPLSAYMLYCKAKRSKIQKKHPGISFKDSTQKLSAKWKIMTPQEKAKYVQSHDEAMKHYRDTLKLFHETYPDAKELLSRSKKPRSESVEHSTQTSLLATPGKSSALPDEETDDSSSDESEVGGANKQEEETKQSDSDESDSEPEEASTQSSPLIVEDKSPASNFKSHDQSHDSSSSTTNDLSSSDSDSD